MLTLFAPIAMAQEGAEITDDSDRGNVLEEIVVTAQRREQSIQQVPISIQAFTAEELEKKGIASQMDLQFHVPGLVMGQFMGFGQMYMRGIGMTNIVAGLDSPIAVYVDGVYQSRPFTTMYAFLDVERVEVLKGPQGTLYGRNATGGAVNIVSKAASRELEGQADIQFGSQNQKVFRVTVSGPLSEGTAYFRLSAVLNKDDGPTNNVTLGTPGNMIDSKAFRASLELTPSDALNVVLNARYNENKSSDNFKLINETIARKVNPAFLPFPPFNAEWNDDFYTLTADSPGITVAKQKSVDATITYDMVGARLTSVTAGRKETWNISSIDFDGTEKNVIIGGPISEDIKFFSQEFILASDSESPLQWTTLAYLSHQKTDYAAGVHVPFFAPPPAFQLIPGDITNDSMGIGGEVSYALDNGVTLVAGTRYSKESVENHMQTTFNGQQTSAGQDDKTTWTAWTPKLVVQYAATTDAMLYASATKGFKSGGYATQEVDRPWDPEKVTSLEVGVKSTWLGGKLRVNAAVFDMDYKDMQMSRGIYGPNGTLATINSNAARSTIRGFELELSARPTPGLELLGGLQVLRAEFDEYTAADPFRPEITTEVSVAGNPLIGAPRLAVNFGVQYTWPSAFQGVDITLRGDGYHRSKVYYTPFKDESVGGNEDLGFLGNVRLSFDQTGARGMYGALSIKNISDERHHTHIRAGSGGYASFPASGRTFSVQLGYRF